MGIYSAPRELTFPLTPITSQTRYEVLPVVPDYLTQVIFE